MAWRGGHASAAPAPVPTPDPLVDEVGAYRAATAREALEPEAALAAWRRFRAGWPRSPLAHSADLRVLALLVRLDRPAELTVAARAFLARYPTSPRAGDVRAMLAAP